MTQRLDVVYDPFAPEFVADPYPFYARYRRESPVFFSPALDYWVLTRYHDVRTAFRDTTDYSASNVLAPFRPLPPRAAAVMSGGGFRSVPTLPNADPPAHTRVRKMVTAAFTPRLVNQMESFIRELAVRFIEERMTGGSVDIIRAMTWELPALVIFEVLGVPDRDIEQVKAWSATRAQFQFSDTDEDEQVRMATELVAFWHYTEDLIAERREEPREDFTSQLLTTVDDDGLPLLPDEIATLVYGLQFAGHETTTNLLTNAVRRLLEHPTAWDEIREDPSLIPNAIEEVLRFDAPGVVSRRKTKGPVTVRGVDIPAEADLLLVIGSANRDEEVFDNPETFDIRRQNAIRHLSFGSGNHLCLGAPLARLEARIVLEELSQRRPDLRLVPDQQLTFAPSISMRAPQTLFVESVRRPQRHDKEALDSLGDTPMPPPKALPLEPERSGELGDR
jgi:cytochrome P450